MKDGLTTNNNGDKFWFLNGQYHRKAGPAIESANGSKWWYLNGKLHREDGPACEDAGGTKRWFLNGEKLECKTQEEFEQLMRIRAFL